MKIVLVLNRVKYIYRFIIYKNRNVRYVRASVNELRRQHRTFVRPCYTLTYPHRHVLFYEKYL